jgi:DNA-binding ferritin-like protein
MQELAQHRRQVVDLLTQALQIAEEIADGTTAYLIDRALDEARAHILVPATKYEGP